MQAATTSQIARLRISLTPFHLLETPRVEALCGEHDQPHKGSANMPTQKEHCSVVASLKRSITSCNTVMPIQKSQWPITVQSPPITVRLHGLSGDIHFHQAHSVCDSVHAALRGVARRVGLGFE